MTPRDLPTRARTIDSDALRLRILELAVEQLADPLGNATVEGPRAIAELVDRPRSEVQGVLGFAGWPSRAAVTRARDAMRQRLEPAAPTVIKPSAVRPGPVPPAPEIDVERLVSDVPTFRAAMVRVSSVRAHPSNLGRDLGDLRDLAASIKAHGLRVPLALEVAGSGYRIRDGHRRHAAAIAAGVKTLPALIHRDALDDKDWLLESIDYNTRRQGYTPEDVRRVARQLEELGVDRRGIADAFQVSATKLRQVLNGPKEPAPVAAAKKASAVVSRKKLRSILDRYRARLERDGEGLSGSVGEFLAEIDEFLA